MTETTINTLADYEQALAKHPRVFLFKHSPICPISAAARAEYRVFCIDHPDVPTLFVNVIANRATARSLAERCGVTHQSPQAILFEAGEATWNTSHDGITHAALEAAWAPRC